MNGIAGIMMAGSIMASVALGQEIDFGDPAPDQEIERANAFVSERLGSDLFKSAVIRASSGLMNSGGEITGYFVCYRFFPPSCSGIYVPFCVDCEVGGECHDFLGAGRIPNCGENPELCDVSIDIPKALQIALDNGLENGLANASISLRLVVGYKSLVWVIREKPVDVTGNEVDHFRWRQFLVDAGTGKVEISRKN